MCWRDTLVVICMGLGVALGGCGKPASVGPESASKGDGTESAGDGSQASPALVLKAATPEAAATEFLEAVRTGNDRVAEAMFTNLARERIGELDIQVAPRGSDTARFEVGKAELLDPDGARVPCKWTDLDKEGKSRTDDMIWMLRKQSEGWRVAGMAATVFEGENPLLLDFENPKETIEKLEMLRDEIARRSVQPPPTESARQAENPPEQMRR